jgi:hypothetical protein
MPPAKRPRITKTIESSTSENPEVLGIVFLCFNILCFNISPTLLNPRKNAICKRRSLDILGTKNREDYNGKEAIYGGADHLVFTAV